MSENGFFSGLIDKEKQNTLNFLMNKYIEQNPDFAFLFEQYWNNNIHIINNEVAEVAKKVSDVVGYMLALQDWIEDRILLIDKEVGAAVEVNDYEAKRINLSESLNKAQTDLEYILNQILIH